MDKAKMSAVLGDKFSKWTSRSLIAWAGATWLLVNGEHISSSEWMYVTVAMIFGTKALDVAQALVKR